MPASLASAAQELYDNAGTVKIKKPRYRGKEIQFSGQDRDKTFLLRLLLVLFVSNNRTHSVATW